MMSDPQTLQELEAYAGIDCEACETGAQAVVTDINGIHLCRDCADGCKLPRSDA